MDTPFGRLSSHHRNSITENLPLLVSRLIFHYWRRIAQTSSEGPGATHRRRVLIELQPENQLYYHCEAVTMSNEGRKWTDQVLIDESMMELYRDLPNDAKSQPVRARSLLTKTI